MKNRIMKLHDGRLIDLDPIVCISVDVVIDFGGPIHAYLLIYFTGFDLWSGEEGNLKALSWYLSDISKKYASEFDANTTNNELKIKIEKEIWDEYKYFVDAWTEYKNQNKGQHGKN